MADWDDPLKEWLTRPRVGMGEVQASPSSYPDASNVPAAALTGDYATDMQIARNLAAKGQRHGITKRDAVGAGLTALGGTVGAMVPGVPAAMVTSGMMGGGMTLQDPDATGGDVALNAAFNSLAGGLTAKYGPELAHYIVKQIRAGNQRGHIVFHGTPATWAAEEGKPLGQFRRTFKHTGEGGAYKGAGGYVAEAPQTAEAYRKSLSDKSFRPLAKDQQYRILFGKDFTEADPVTLKVGGYLSDAAEYGEAESAASARAIALKRFQKAEEEALSDLQQRVPRLRRTARDPSEAARIEEWEQRAQRELDEARQAMRVLESVPDAAIEQAGLVTRPGSLYALDFPDELLPRVLDFDAPLSKQTPEVREALRKAGVWPEVKREVVPPAGEFPDPLEKVSGEDLYQALVRKRGGRDDAAAAEAASQALREAGIPAHRFLDQGSRGAGEGTHNFVVYDPDTTLRTVGRYDSLDTLGKTATEESRAKLLARAAEARAREAAGSSTAGGAAAFYESQAADLPNRTDLIREWLKKKAQTPTQ